MHGNLLPTRADPGQTRTALVLIAPALVLIAVFLVAPGVLALAGSFFEIDLTNGVRWTWTGLDNFAAVLGDDVIRRSMVNTVVYCALTILPSLAIGLGLALLVESFGRGRTLLRTLLFLPFTANLVAMAVVFRWIFALHGGFANQLLALIGVGPLNYLGDERLALPTLAAVGIWRGVALTMVLFLAGLAAIPTAIHEAAAADGVRGLAKLRTVTLPMLRPMVVFATVMMVLGSVQVFDTINVMTDGGPLYATETVLTMTWRLAYGYYELGQAAAMSVLVLVVLIGVGVVRRRSLLGADR